MPVTEMQELLKHELGDLLFAEQKILGMLRTVSREIQSPEVKARVLEHMQETEGQVERLKRAFTAIGEKAKAQKCPGILGLQEEHDSFKSEESPSPPLLEAFDLGSGLRVEHYEIAGYRSAIALARVLGHEDCADLLRESLAEEEAMAKFLEKNALKSLTLLSAQARDHEQKRNGRAASGRTAAKPAKSARASSSRSTSTKTKKSGTSRRSATSAPSTRSGGSTRRRTAAKK